MKLDSYSLKGIQKAYEAYLVAMYPDASNKFIHTKSDDAFCLFRWFSLKEALEYTQGIQNSDVRALILSNLVTGRLKNRKKPMKDAKGYLREVARLQIFLQIVSLIDASRVKQPRKVSVEVD